MKKVLKWGMRLGALGVVGLTGIVLFGARQARKEADAQKA